MKIQALNADRLSFEPVPGNKLGATYLRIQRADVDRFDTVIPLSYEALCDLMVAAEIRCQQVADERLRKVRL
jgi:hypothetical protein